MMERKQQEMMTAYSAVQMDAFLPSGPEPQEEKKPFDMHSRNGTRIEFLKVCLLPFVTPPHCASPPELLNQFFPQ